MAAARLPEAEREAADSRLFIAFIGTIAWTLSHTFIGNPVIDLYWIPMSVTLSDLQWYVAINAYIALFWYERACIYNDNVYRWISACYVFAILEMFAVWDRPWFKFLSIPVTSNTLIFFGFAYAYYRNIRARYW